MHRRVGEPAIGQVPGIRSNQSAGSHDAHHFRYPSCGIRHEVDDEGRDRNIDRRVWNREIHGIAELESNGGSQSPPPREIELGVRWIDTENRLWRTPLGDKAGKGAASAPDVDPVKVQTRREPV